MLPDLLAVLFLYITIIVVFTFWHFLERYGCKVLPQYQKLCGKRSNVPTSTTDDMLLPVEDETCVPRGLVQSRLKLFAGGDRVGQSNPQADIRSAQSTSRTEQSSANRRRPSANANANASLPYASADLAQSVANVRVHVPLQGAKSSDHLHTAGGAMPFNPTASGRVSYKVASGDVSTALGNDRDPNAGGRVQLWSGHPCYGKVTQASRDDSLHSMDDHNYQKSTQASPQLCMIAHVHPNERSQSKIDSPPMKMDTKLKAAPFSGHDASRNGKKFRDNGKCDGCTQTEVLIAPSGSWTLFGSATANDFGNGLTKSKGRDIQQQGVDLAGDVQLLLVELDAASSLNKQLSTALARCEREAAELRTENKLHEHKLRAAVASAMADAVSMKMQNRSDNALAYKVSSKADTAMPGTLNADAERMMDFLRANGSCRSDADLREASMQTEPYGYYGADIMESDKQDRCTQADFDNAGPSVAELQQAVEEMCREREIYVNRADEVNHYKEQVKHAEKRIDEAKESWLAERQKLLQSVDDIKQKFEALQKENDDQKAAEEIAESSKLHITQEELDAHERLKIDHSRLKDANNSLAHNLKQLEKRLHEVHVETEENAHNLKGRHDDIVKQRDSLLGEVDILKSQLSSTEHERTLERANAARTQSEIEAQLGNISRECDSLREMVDSLKSDNDGIQRQNQDLLKKLKDSEGGADQGKKVLEEKLSSLQASLKFAHNNIKIQESDLKQLQSQLEEQCHKNELLESELAQHQMPISDVHKHTNGTADLSEENRGLAAELKKQQRLVVVLRRRLAALEGANR